MNCGWRRYRVNGTVRRNDAAGIAIEVREAYPNCPKYIQKRELRALDMHAGSDGSPGHVAMGATLAGAGEALVRAADTLFIVSSHPDTGADASHRGGPRGFVQIEGPSILRIPDYHGNLALNPHVGLCIPDFENSRLQQLSGRARLPWDHDDPAQARAGTGRFLEVEVDRRILRRASQRLEWEYLDACPFNPPVLGA